MNVFRFKDINGGYMKLVKYIVKKPDYFQTVKGGFSVNDKPRWHLWNVHVEFRNVKKHNFFKVKCPDRSRVMNNYMNREQILFDEGVISSDEMGKISKIWKLIENPDCTINANYGYMVHYIQDAGNPKWGPVTNQWTWALNRLVENPETLKAYMHFNRPKDQWALNRDQPCTVFVQFTIRGGKLNLHSYMRSNDIIYGLPYNVAYFRHLMLKMQQNLMDNKICVELGSIYHNTTSLHLYEDKLPVALKIIGN